MKPFTVAHFKAWASDLTLDSGKQWEVEDFQVAFVRDVFRGYIENWLIVPEGNAKTTLVAGLVLYHALFRPFARVVVAASSKDQADWLFDAAKGFVDRSALGPPEDEGESDRRRHERIARQPDIFRCYEGIRVIRVNQSKIRIFAADDRTGDGANFTLAVLEELHRHRDMRLYRTWRGKAEKQAGQVVAISTAGLPDGEFEQIRTRMKLTPDRRHKGGFMRAASETTVLHDYSVPEDKDPDNMAHVKMANPLKAITMAQLRRKHDSPSFNAAHWRRFNCGNAAVIDSWLNPEDWDRLAVDLGTVRDGEPVWIGVRYGQQGGAGIGIVAERGEGVAVRIDTLPYDFRGLDFALRRLCERYDVQAIYVDPRHFGGESMIETVFGDLVMESDYQTPVRLMEATATFLRHVSSGTLHHDGDPKLRAQVLSGRVKETTTGAYLEPAAEYSALVAMVMAVHEASKGYPQDPMFVAPSVVA